MAISWGIIDDLEWEFRLRPNVKFHNGEILNTDDVIASFDRAKKHKSSQLTGFMQNIKKIEKIDDMNLKIYTKTPNPLLLNQLATILIMPEEHAESTVIKESIGTGSYEIKDWKKGKVFRVKESLHTSKSNIL